MLTHLDYSVEFPTTGRSFSNRIDFAPGLTAITGRNEAGKTVVLEMLRYCLFGKSALRGQASDYRNLRAKLVLRVNDRDWTIERTARSEQLFVGGDLVATGASALDKKIPELLGFDLTVFDIACSANQGDLDALTKMRPTARRQMVDQLIGMDRLEEVEKACKDEAKVHRQVADSLANRLAPPVEPEKPEGYRPTSEIQPEIQTLSEKAIEYRTLLAIREPAAPEKPVDPAIVGTIGELEAHQTLRQEILEKKARLEGQLSAIPVATHSLEEVEKAESYFTYLAEVQRRGPKPEMPLVEVEMWIEQWKLHAAWLQFSRSSVTCPACEHNFVPESPHEHVDQVDEPPYSLAWLEEQVRADQRWLEPLPVVEYDGDLNRNDVANARRAAEGAVQRRACEDELASLVVPVDRRGDLAALRDYQSSLLRYETALAHYQSQKLVFDEAQARLAGFQSDPAQALAELQALAHRCDAYERALARFGEDTAAYERALAEVRERSDAADQYTSGAEALKAARARVKRELVPSLSLAASTLLSAMTSGQRSKIIVDEDFEVMVDGQPLRTLSGSGQSVVNLALRLGIGQVLTSKVLPIFLGDEVDAAMDKVRAECTHATFQNLTKYLSQIILVTHKDIESDNIITLEAWV